MQSIGVLLGLVASCALLPGHNGVKAPSTLSASPAVVMVATAMPELQMPAVRHGLPAQRKGGDLHNNVLTTSTNIFTNLRFWSRLT